MEMLSVIKSKLPQIKPELMARYGISSNGSFGSIVRHDFTNNSDIDIIVDFSKPIGIEFISLANELESLLMRKVDLVSRDGIEPKYMQIIETQIEYV